MLVLSTVPSSVARRVLSGVLTPHLCDSLADDLETGQFTIDGAKDGVANARASGVETWLRYHSFPPGVMRSR